MQRTTEVVIIGGGIIGCAIAYYLRKRNVDIIVLERGEIGAEASSAAAGLLAPLGPLAGPGPFADLLLAGFALFPSLVPELEDATGLHLGYAQTGALRTVRNSKRVANLRKRMEAWQPLGLEMQWLSGDEARQREPLLASDVCAAIYAPEEAQIQAPQLVQAFFQAARKLGARFYTHKEVIGIQHKHFRVTDVHIASGETITCNHLIVATGAWTALYDEWFSLALPVSPLQGQILSLQQPVPPLQHIVFGDAAYLTPKGGSILVGATKEEVGFDAHVTDEGVSWLYDTAIRLAPSLKFATAEASWVGLRPKTPDTRPILGPLLQWKNVTLATGHNSVGIMLSAITGQAIAEYVTTGRVPEIIRPFSVERFIK